MGNNMNLMELIESYIIFLITECGLSVSLHPQDKETLITFSRLMRFNLHDISYCACIKSTPEGRKRCLEQQKKAYRRCKEKGEDFSGVCHAGVFEQVYPISDGESVTGFISISGYSCDEEGKRLDNAVRVYGCSREALSRYRSSLRTPPSDKHRLDTLVLPLVRMLELAYRSVESSLGEKDRITSVRRYVMRNYASDITTERICKEFHGSRSGFSHTFKKETGKSFREYLTEVRLSHAKRLLKYSNLTVTEIALSVGFNDANYFSNVFKKYLGTSPTAYRKS